jgi:environmental stress-induced protein Ves
VRLDFGQRARDLTVADAPLCFSGDDPVQGRLLAGPVQDLNLMVRRDGDGAIAQMLRVCAPQRWEIDADRVIAIYSAQELTEVQLDSDHQTLPARTLAWRVATAGSTLRVTASVAFCMIFAAPP